MTQFRSSVHGSTLRTFLVVLLVAGHVGGCGWFGKSRPSAGSPVVAADAQSASRNVDVQTATAALAACTNYGAATQAAPFPRDAIIRGIDAGTATVRFAVAGSTITVLSVTSSAPAFGDAAADIVRTLTCRVERPTVFEVPFSWRTTRP